MNHKNQPAALYDASFFEPLTAGALQSARVIVPLLLRLVHPESVIDVGCGLGAWLKVFQEYGVQRVRGIDGDYIDRAKLMIEPTCFTSVDLAEGFELSECYDLAICLEVAEHLPAAAASRLVRSLTGVAPMVLFSAAIPGQKGSGHVNEQWPSYWKPLFAAHGFQRLDPLRRAIWRDNRVQWFYRQNLFLYVSQEVLRQSEALRTEESLAELDVIYIDFLNRFRTLRGVLGELRRVASDALTRRMGG